MSTTPIWVLVGLLCVACQRGADSPPASRPAGSGAPLVVGAELKQPQPHGSSYDGGLAEFLTVTMDELFPIFCTYRSMPLGEKSALWNNRFAGKWIRWTGKIRSITPNGLTLQVRPEALTFDVSLWMDSGAQTELARLYKTHDRVVFSAQLSTYDDVFQKLYLAHGVIERKLGPPDGGGKGSD
jgi:hypothetical protein